MRIFISHKQEDQDVAAAIAAQLRYHHNVESYLDVFDPNTHQAGDELGDYMRDKLNSCTDLMAVVSEKTKWSWWVPWEIGIGTEKDYPISTFARERCDLPTYLKKWPYLRTLDELDTYIRVAKQVRQSVDRERYQKTAVALRATYARQFHRNLKRALGQ